MVVFHWTVAEIPVEWLPSGSESPQGSEPTNGSASSVGRKPESDVSLDGYNLGRSSPDANGIHGPPCACGHPPT